MQNEFKEHETDPKRKNFKIYKTVLEIMEARGYGVDPDQKNMTFEQYAENEQQYNREKQTFYQIQEDEDEQDENAMQRENNPNAILVYFNPEKYSANPVPISQNKIKNLVSASSEIKKFFIIGGTESKGKIPSVAIEKKAAAYIDSASKQKQIDIELFRDEDLMFNILKHDLVPEHKVLTKKQKEELLKKYKVKDPQLPKILLSDPVARFLGLKRGQVVKINRKSQTAGTYTTYRIAL